ncbi:MAG: undecaprenyl-diphosphate phosphatase [Formivibrio sp.]|nr:undecaprenyl-diphosphate phosphatase [Formivibrio sp.]
MDMVLLFKSIIMGIVEGLTEFLPISSTGHLILSGELLHFLDKEKRDVFEIFIQFGAMLAVVWEYRSKISGTLLGAVAPGRERSLLINIIAAFIPAAFVGLFFNNMIKAALFKPVPVALAFIIGGFVILWAEKRQHRITVETVDDLTLLDAIKVGFCQCFALIPGTSRSGATIIGGLFLGLSRKAATEFSFFLAIPTLSAASIYSLWKVRHILEMQDIGIFAVGFLAAMVSAFFAVRALLKFISSHTFIAFAWYRIAFGLVILLTAWQGWINWAA